MLTSKEKNMKVIVAGLSFGEENSFSPGHPSLPVSVK